MPSNRNKKRGGKANNASGGNNTKGSNSKSVESAVSTTTTDSSPIVISDRTATGVLASRPDSCDIKIEGFSLVFKGRELVSDTTIELNYRRRYGLIGFNGSGKSTLLNCLGAREVPIPEHMDIYHLKEEAAPTDRTAIQAVIDGAQKEVRQLFLVCYLFE